MPLRKRGVCVLDSLVYHARGNRVFARGEAKLGGCGLREPRRAFARASRIHVYLGACGLLPPGLRTREPHSGGGRMLAAPGLSPRRTAAPYSTSNK